MLYTVKSGDSLSKIARDVLGDMPIWPELARINNILAPYIINPGQKLVLPEIGLVKKPISFPAPASSPATAPTPVTTSFNRPFWRNKKMMAWLAVAAVGVFFLMQQKFGDK